MNIDARRARRIVYAGNGVVALAVSACLLVLLGLGFGAVPALGPALVPGHGAWRSPAGARLAGPGRWQWGRLHARQYPSLAQSAVLGGGRPNSDPAAATIWEPRP